MSTSTPDRKVAPLHIDQADPVTPDRDTLSMQDIECLTPTSRSFAEALMATPEVTATTTNTASSTPHSPEHTIREPAPARRSAGSTSVVLKDLADAKMSGWLMKRCGRWMFKSVLDVSNNLLTPCRSWKRRWVVIQGSYLYYFHSRLPSAEVV